jgi:hypothetical protein
MREGMERIKILASDVKDNAVLEIVNYLLSREDMNEKYLNEEKSLKEMLEYIRSKAIIKAVNNMAIIKDEEVFSWAIHYFDETNNDLKINSTENKVEQKNEKVVDKNKNVKKEWISEGQLTLF